MESIRKYVYIITVMSLIIFIVLNQMTYSTEYKNNEMQNEISNLESQNEEIRLKMTSNASKTEVEQNNPDLKFNNNVYYLEEDNNEKEEK